MSADTPLSARLAREAPFTLVIAAAFPAGSAVVLPFSDRVERDEAARHVAQASNVHALQIATRRASGGAEVDTWRPAPAEASRAAHGRLSRTLADVLDKHRRLP